MYLCFEGIKGTGKTTAFEALRKKLDEAGILHSTICPTKPIAEFYLREFLNRKFIFLRNFHYWSGWIYAERSNYSASKAIRENRSVTIGDRSKLTSYVVRRMQGLSWNQAFTLIDRAENIIPLPNIVVYLTLDPDVSYNRLKARNSKDSIRKHETLDSLKTSASFYDELIEGELNVKLADIQYIIVNANLTPDDIANIAFEVISKSLNTTKLCQTS